MKVPHFCGKGKALAHKEKSSIGILKKEFGIKLVN